MNFGPLVRSPEELRSSRLAGGDLGKVEGSRAQLLELRTGSEPLYVCPSRWQRLRLRWAFRHFRVLPPQVLSASNQRLIERLIHSALVTPALPVTPGQVFGVVESVRSQPSAGQVGQLRTERMRPLASGAKPQTLQFGRPDFSSRLPDPKGPSAVPSGPIRIRRSVALAVAPSRRARFVGDARFQQWGALGTLAAVGLMVILLRFYNPSLLPGPAPIGSASTAPVPAKRAALDLKAQAIPPLIAVLPPPVLLSFLDKPKHQIVLPALETTLAAEKSTPVMHSDLPAAVSNSAVASTGSAATVPSGDADLFFVSELPEGHFAEPVVTDSRLVGELRLRALIGADGSVKQVTVVSGSPQLAEIGMRAVRRWRYQALGHPGEAETLIRMRFFGQDGVSIASIAK